MLLLCLFTMLGDPETATLNQVIDQWHEAAAQADAETYFGLMDEHAVFLGTDATERWTRSEFEAWAAPHFEGQSAWTLKPLGRRVTVSRNGRVAWFDEDLETSMGPCRGSGVLEKVGGEWKIMHYVLSMTIPNDAVDEVRPVVQRVLNRAE